MKIAFFKLESWAKELVENSPILKGNEFIFFDHTLDEKNIPETKDFEIASVFVDSAVNSAVINQLPNLKLIATRSTGYDHIDVKTCKEKGVLVASVPAYGENTVAEFTFALLLTLSRRIFDSVHHLKEEGEFNSSQLQGFDLKGKILGVVGTGRIGKHVIKIAKGFGMEVVASDAHPDQALSQELGFEYVSFDELLAKSDIITLHVPFIKETEHLINKDNIGKIKKGAYIINTSRGGVIETEALVKALKDGNIAGAGLDVLEEEGVIRDELDFLMTGNLAGHNMKTVLANHVLLDMPNVVITPHNAFNTKEAIKRILNTTLENISSFVSGKPTNTVNG